MALPGLPATAPVAVVELGRLQAGAAWSPVAAAAQRQEVVVPAAAGRVLVVLVVLDVALAAAPSERPAWLSRHDGSHLQSAG